MTCESCNKIVHSECAKYSYVFNHMSNSWHCSDCTDTEIKRYNPFSDIIFDKFDPVQISESEDIAEISKILENCQSFDPSNFQNILNRNPDLKNMPSALFNNIDGNKSNFDDFVSDISQYCHLFSFIGISETSLNHAIRAYMRSLDTHHNTMLNILVRVKEVELLSISEIATLSLRWMNFPSVLKI